MPEKNKQKILNVPEKQLPIEPLTLKEIHEAAVKRVALIAREFRNGFEFIKDYAKSVTFFGSSLLQEGHPYYNKSRSLAYRVVKELGYSIFTGGGPGLMEAANRGGFEAGGNSLGLNIKLPHEQATNPYLTDHISFYYFFGRRVCLAFSAEAYVFFPGGFGTSNEFFEILTLVQTNKISPVPIILVGKEFWTALEDFMREKMIALGTIEEEDLKLYTITDDEDEIMNIIRNAPVRNGIRYKEGAGKVR